MTVELTLRLPSDDWLWVIDRLINAHEPSPPFRYNTVDLKRLLGVIRCLEAQFVDENIVSKG